MLESHSLVVKTVRLSALELDAIDELVQQAHSPWKTFSEFLREALTEKIKASKGVPQVTAMSVAAVVERIARHTQAQVRMDKVILDVDTLLQESKKHGYPIAPFRSAVEGLTKEIMGIEDKETREYWLHRVRNTWPEWAGKQVGSTVGSL